MTAPRILIAGIGNLFLGDDGFGVETARRLAARPQPEGVRIEDFGIRGLDLVEADADENATVLLDAHGMDPVKVLALARSMGAPTTRTFVVGCEPGFMP